MMKMSKYEFDNFLLRLNVSDIHNEDDESDEQRKQERVRFAKGHESSSSSSGICSKKGEKILLPMPPNKATIVETLTSGVFAIIASKKQNELRDPMDE